MRLTIARGSIHARTRRATDACQMRTRRLSSFNPRPHTTGDGIELSIDGQAILVLAQEQDASMGPRLFNRGNVRELRQPAPPVMASMGPRSFNRGNTARLASSVLTTAYNAVFERYAF